MASRLPVPKSYEQINGDMLATYLSKIGVNDLNVGSVVTSFFEAMAQAVYRSSGDTFAILRDFSVDRAEGEALKRLAEEERVLPIPARVATGRINITDTSFQKISTKVYAGTPPPNIGTTQVFVSDASLFPSTGSVYIGRGTPNVEGPIPYSSIDNLGGFFRLNLSQPTTKYHNNSENVILAQGGVRNISAGTTVRTPASGASASVFFSTTQAASILDGETEVLNVPVAAQEPGIIGNVPRNSINQFASNPFAGASVTNPSPFTTGRNEETDEEIRIRIKRQRISKGLGTAIAVKSSVLGAQATDENAIITSNEILSTGDRTTLFIDNGQGYEEKTRGVGLEFIVDSALGGEQFFQLATGGSQTSVTKAFLRSSNMAPYDIRPNDRLSILVGGVLSEHVFQEGDFRANGSATAFEVVASINANPNVSFSARTIEEGNRVTVSAKAEQNEFIQKTSPTVGRDAGLALNISTNEVETLKLFKNGQPLSRNGRTATIESENQNNWSNTIADGDTLIISVDRTAFITYTFNNADFAAEGTHTTVARSNSLQSWVNVINTKITGVTASINGTRIVLASNLGNSSRASIQVDNTSTLVTKGVFTTNSGLSAQGREADFTLSRNTAQIKLTRPLAAGDSLTAGNDLTQAAVTSSQILGGNTTLPADAEAWFLVDNKDAAIIPNGVLSDSIVHFVKQGGNIIRFRSNLLNAFSNIQVGDYVVISSEQLLPVNRIEGRVYSVGTQIELNDYFEIKVTTAEYNLAVTETPVNFLEGLDFLRSDVPPQKVQIAAGSYQISDVANLISDQLVGVDSKTEDDEFIILSSKNRSTDGSILVFTINDAAKNIGFTKGTFSQSNDSLIGFKTSGDESKNFPLFFHSSVTLDASANPTLSYIPSVDSALALTDIDPNAFFSPQHPYLTAGSFIRDVQAADERVLVDDIAGTVVDLDDSPTIRRMRAGDRFYLLNTLDLSHNDRITVILDSDPSNKTFPINLFRRATTNPTMPINADEFRAFDTDGGSSAQFTQFFGSDFTFKNYKVLMRARNVIDPSSSADEDAILFRSAVWGEAGEKYNVGYFYPTSPDQGVTSLVTVRDEVFVNIFLKSGPAVVNTIDGTTEWDVTVTPNTPVVGVDEVTYAWSGTGTNPNLAALTPGDYVSINSLGEFSPENRGTFRISNATATSFTVRRPSGVAAAENDVATLTTSTISLYEDDATTAQDIIDHVTDDLGEYILATAVDDNGVNASGAIDKSTFEDNSFATDSSYVQLVDGINWIESTNLSANAPNPQFRLKRTLSLPSFNTNTPDGYAFNQSEELRLIPVSIKQISQFLSVLAVTGISTLSDVGTAFRDSSLQFSSQVLGSSGSVLVTGGPGNRTSAPIIGVTQRINGTNFIRSSITKASSSGLGGGSWVKLQALNKQRKVTGFRNTTQVEIAANTPGPNESTVTLINREPGDKYFNQPRNAVRTRNRAFHVEKQGSLVLITWDGTTSTDPFFSKAVNINGSGGGDISVDFNSETLSTEYTVASGSRNFSEVQEGDVLTISGFSNSVNNGTFTVNGVSDDALTVSVASQFGVAEASTAIAAGDLTVSTEVKEGDTLEISAPFASLNQGRFRVVRRFQNGVYIENPSAVEERVIVGNNLRSLGFDATTELDVTVPGNMRIEWNGNGTQPSFENAVMGDVITIGTAFDIANRGDFMVVDSGPNFIEVQNANAVAESAIIVSSVGGDIFECQAPSLLFSSYETTRPGDIFVISGNVLGANNQGSYNVVKVINRNTIVVDDIMQTVNPATQLDDLFVQVYIEEGVEYSGYKKIHTIATNPANPNQTFIIFEGLDQFNKINEAGDVTMSSVGKLGFLEQQVTGFDSYKYHTGLLAEANRIVYGDPRDEITYPGVAAAGAEIFIEPPLIKRIQISINVRLNTGIPFVRITEEVRNAIAALINSSPIGVSIAISDIISAVNGISGVRAVSISSPAYDPTNDVIVVNPAEKPFVLDIVNDITVSKVG